MATSPLCTLRLIIRTKVIELLPIAMDLTHWGLYQADCPRCGLRIEAPLPPSKHQTVSGPRLSGLIGDMASVQGTRRSFIQIFRASVLGFSIGLEAIQKVLDRVTLSIQPPYETIAHLVRHSPVIRAMSSSVIRLIFLPPVAKGAHDMPGLMI